MGRRPLPALALVAALVAAPSAADWLVTRAGSRVETRGPWRVEGKLVVFTLPSGSLSSLRAADVDLDASRRLTAEAAAPAAKPAPRRAEAAARPRFALTDKDVRHGEAPAAAAAKAGKEAAEKEKKTEDGKAAGGLAVASWERGEENGHAVVRGRLRNDSKVAAAGIALTVHVFDDAGTRLASAPATLSATVLMPGQEATFQVDFPDVATFASLKFDSKSSGLAVAPQPQAAKPPGR